VNHEFANRQTHFQTDSEHQSDHGEAAEGGDGPGVALEVAGEPPISAHPGEGPLDDPALGQDDEAMRVGALDDLERPVAGRGDEARRLRPLIPGVGEDALDEREASARPA
jgi:hypothetical protein